MKDLLQKYAISPQKYKDLLGAKNLECYNLSTSQKLKKRLLNHYGSNIFVTNEMNETSLHFFLFISTAVRLTFPRFFNLQLFIKKMHCYKELIENVSERVTYDFWMRCWNTKSWYNECWRHINSTSWSHGYHRQQIVNIVPESLKVFLDKLCKGYGPNNKTVPVEAKNMLVWVFP